MTTNRGMSLIEVLIYIGILTFLTVVIMNMLATITKTGRTMHIDEARTRSAIVMLNRLDKAVRSAGSATGGGTALTLDGVSFDISQFVETGVLLENISYTLSDASTSVKVRAAFTLDGLHYSSATLLHKTDE